MNQTEKTPKVPFPLKKIAGIKIPLSSRGNVVWCAIGVSLLTTVRELFDNGENALLGNQTLAYTLRDLEAFFMVGAFVAAAAPTYLCY